LLWGGGFCFFFFFPVVFGHAFEEAADCAFAGAAVAVGEDVAALVLFGFGGVLHVCPPHGWFLMQSLRKTWVRSGLISELAG
jgi:hypothetical protein